MKLNSILGFLVIGATAIAAPISISTGTAAPWLVNGNPVVAETVIPSPIWINNFGDGVWVGTTANDGNPGAGIAPGTYTFTLDIGSFMAGDGTFSIQYAADNSATWSITGGALAGDTACNAGGANSDCFQAASGAARTLTGSFTASSVLTVTVVNGASGNNPMGLLAVGAASLNSDVPEPSTYAMLVLGTLAIGAARIRRR